jgi:hypothetical protein
METHQMTDSLTATPVDGTASQSRKWNVGRDIVGGITLLIALFAPWNLSFGFGIDGSSGRMFAALVVVTVLSLASIAVTFVSKSSLATRLRLWLNVAYLLFVAAIVLWDLLITLLYGSSGQVAPGVGPGAWIGVTGALLCAQPVLGGQDTDDASFRNWFGAARIIGVVAIAFGVQSFVFNMYWRIRSIGSADAIPADGAQHFGYLVAATVYGALSLSIVVIAASWIVRNTASTRLAVVGLGAATIATALVVWASDAGLHIVPVQGAVSNTGSGIGFQGYLLWCAAAAIFAPAVLHRAVASDVLRSALRHCLLLIAVWCFGMIAVRLAYLGLALSSNQSLSVGVTTTMIVVNLAAGAVAIWLRRILTSDSGTGLRIATVSGALFVLTIIRVVVDIVSSAQRITGTFNVVVSFLALIVAAAVLWFPTARRRAAVSGNQPRIFVAPAD